jgi:hypothetical protein
MRCRPEDELTLVKAIGSNQGCPMAVSAEFGPNTAAVRAFLESIKDVPWFSQVGQPTGWDGELTRVEFDFLAQHHEAPYAS